MKFSSLERVRKLICRSKHMVLQTFGQPADTCGLSRCLHRIACVQTSPPEGGGTSVHRLAQDWAIQVCPAPEEADPAHGHMFPRVYLEVSLRVSARVPLWSCSRASMTSRSSSTLGGVSLDITQVNTISSAQPRKIFFSMRLGFRRPLFVTLFFHRSTAQLAQCFPALRTANHVRLCCSTGLVAVGGDEAWYGLHPHLLQIASINQLLSARDFLSFC